MLKIIINNSLGTFLCKSPPALALAALPTVLLLTTHFSIAAPSYDYDMPFSLQDGAALSADTLVSGNTVWVKNDLITWSEQSSLVPEDLQDTPENFSVGMSRIDNNRIATIASCNSFGTDKAAYIFDRTDTTWSQGVTLPTTEEVCGNIQLDDNTVMLSAKNGAANFIFVRDESGQWYEQAEFRFVSADEFSGMSDFERHETNDVMSFEYNQADGSAYPIFKNYIKSEWLGGKLKQTHLYVYRTGAHTIARQATGLALDGDTAVFSAELTSKWSGSGNTKRAYGFIYERSGEAWEQQIEFTDTGGSERLFYHYMRPNYMQVDLSGNTLIAASLNAHTSGSSYNGMGYIFERINGEWVKTYQVESPIPFVYNESSFSSFGAHVDIEGSTLLITGKASLQGEKVKETSYIFHQTPSGWQYVDNTALGYSVRPVMDGDIAMGIDYDTKSTVAYKGLKDGGKYIGLSATKGFGVQDDSSKGDVLANADGSSLFLSENRWRATKAVFDIDTNTVIAFDMELSKIGEAHGIAFISKGHVQSDRVFQLAGYQASHKTYWTPIKDYNYSGKGKQHFEIPVGQHYTGKNLRLVLVHDNDRVDGSTVTFSNMQLCQDTCVEVNENPLDTNLDLSLHGSFDAQDDVATRNNRTENSGTKLILAGNTWRQSLQRYTLSSDTVLEFYFSGDDINEMQGIGVDNGQSQQFFQLAGYDNYSSEFGGNQDFHTYHKGDGVQLFTIPVGQYLTGDNFNLVFFNDNDALGKHHWAKQGTITFDDVRVCESACSYRNTHNTGEFFDLGFDTTGFSNQDNEVLGAYSVVGDGTALVLEGNRWRATKKTFTISEDTILELTLYNNGFGEMIGIGFDSDDDHSSDRMFNLAGSQPWWGITDYTYTGNGDDQTIRIPVGQYYTGHDMRLVFMSDDDTVYGHQYDSVSMFSNVRLCDGSCE